MTYHYNSVLRVFTRTSLALLASASFLACDSDDDPSTDGDAGAPDSGEGIVDEKDSSTPPVKPPPNNNEDAGDVPIEMDSGAPGDAGLMGDAGDAAVGDAGPTACVDAPASLVGWWQGEGDAVNAVNEEEATPPTSETFADGMVGQGFVLNGTDEFVLVSGDSISVPADGFTVGAWVKPSALTTDRSYVISDSQSGEEGFGLALTGGEGGSGCPGGGARVFASAITSAGLLVACSADTVEVDEIHHVAAKYSAETGTLTVYLDGQASGKAEVAEGSAFAPGTGDIHIGARPYNEGRGFFTGIIDEVDVFDRALSDEQIQSIAEAGAAGKCE